jgi:Flp pilus assembly protein TadD
MKVRSCSNRKSLGTVRLIAWLAVTGCTGLTHPPRPDTKTQTVPAHNDAAGPSATLLAQSRAQRASGSYAQARASVERALAIDPDNAALWVELGEIDLASGRAAEAATMARKALTLAPRDSGAAADASALLERARR